MFLLAALSARSATLQGRIVHAGTETAFLSHISLVPYAFQNIPDSVRTIATDPDGHFRIELPVGLYSVTASAPDHEAYPFVLPLLEDEDVDVEIVLAGLRYRTTFDSVQAIGGWNDWNFEAPTTLYRRSNGLFEATVPARGAGEVSVQMLNIVVSNDKPGSVTYRSVNMPGIGRHLPDGSGDYRTVLAVPPGRDSVTITFDPRLLPKAHDTVGRMEYHGASAWRNTIQTVKHLLAEGYDSLKAAQKREGKESAIPDGEMMPKVMGPYFAHVRQIRDTSSNSTLRGYSAILMLRFASWMNNDSAEIARYRSVLPPSSPLWSLDPDDVSIPGFKIGPVGYHQWLWSVVAGNADRTVRARALRYLATRNQREGNSAMLDSVVRMMQRDYFDLPLVQNDLQKISAGQTFGIGNPVPEFEANLLGGGRVSRASMLGQVYLIDFWATNCAPCRREMPGLHEAWKAFGDRVGFLSFSIDSDSGVIAPYRSRSGGMPWMNAWLPGQFTHPIVQRFKVIGIPSVLLVGADGRIIATEDELRGNNLPVTLARFVGPPKQP